ncbi:PKD domain-containing protein [Lentzea waywayandensis]|uniref:PKD domain-containing protein n=1 Tax=Lentzea waywayandensis TaxID=84724 RepID=A0A1I6FHM4_9PSEU|nr:PKD domain-containing protein [Lentzea waywayandensis]SFR29297.1 PKD domain-containing protein [Lentzea waywayandensis]
MRTTIAALVAVLITALAPGLAHAAEPPSNDDFDHATAVTSLPYHGELTTAGSTKAPDDPTECYYYGTDSVWLSYTAPEDAIVRATIGGQPYMAVYTGERGSLSMVPGTCTFMQTKTDTFHVKAGTTYYFALVEHYAGYGKDFTFDLITVPAEANDDRASASVTGFPATFEGDLRRASSEPDELRSACEPEAVQSVWYRYTADRARFVHLARTQNYGFTVSAFRAGDLSEVDCASARVNNGAVFAVAAGESYLIRVAAEEANAGYFKMAFGNAPAIRPSFSAPTDPSAYNDISFTPYAGDPLGMDLATGEIQFGDGTSAPITGRDTIKHRYAKDGEYNVRVTGSTKDGRSGTTERVLKVETHDVTLSGFSVPSTARAGETKRLKVSVGNNTRFDEEVTVRLEAESGDIGSLTQRVAAAGKVEFPFAYTFTADDVARGTVTFKVAGNLRYRYDLDDNPKDNELTASTKVRPAAGGSTRID